MNISEQKAGTVSFIRVGIILLCFVGTFCLLRNLTGTRATPILQPLNHFPKQLGQWTREGTRLSSSEVVELLGVDDYIDYTYVDPARNRVDLYVGFYESVGGGKGYHSPKNCLPGGGWGIDSVKTVSIHPASRANQSVTISEMVIRKGGEYQVVFYWFQNRGRIISTEYLEKIYLVLDALFKKRRDGTFVRLMIAAPGGDVKQAELILKNFAELSLTELDNFLPGK